MTDGRANIPVYRRPDERFRGIPEPNKDDLLSVYETVAALKEVVETLTGERGDTSNAAILTRHVIPPDSVVPPENVGGGLPGLPEQPPLQELFVTRTEWDDHLELEYPYEQDPHHQYWHKVTDAAFGAMSIDTPVSGLNAGDTIAPMVETVPGYRIGTDAPNGAFLLDGSASQQGVYQMSVFMDVTGISRGEYTFDFYVNGVPAGMSFRLLFGNQQADGHITWSAIVAATTSVPSAVELRCISASSEFTVEGADFSIHRISANPETVG